MITKMSFARFEETVAIEEDQKNGNGNIKLIYRMSIYMRLLSMPFFKEARFSWALVQYNKGNLQLLFHSTYEEQTRLLRHGANLCVQD